MSESLRSRLRQDRACVGAWASIPSSLLVEAMASCGFHWLAVDFEHGAVDVADAAQMFLAAERRGVAPFARLPSADPILARRMLDNGAVGLIVPVVESAESFVEFARHCYYPAAGRRGVGLSRCNDWGDGFAEYLGRFRPFLVPQIETRKGVEAAAGIASLPEVDALFLGPYDLSASLGRPGEFENADFVAAVSSVRAAAKAGGKALGIHQVRPDPAELRRRIDEGFRFVAYGTDVIAMRAAYGNPRKIVGDE